VLAPDFLAAEARRWTHGVTASTDPRISALVVTALGRYYHDTHVVEGIIAARVEGGRGSRRESSGGVDAASPEPLDSREDDAARTSSDATPRSTVA